MMTYADVWLCVALSLHRHRGHQKFFTKDAAADATCERERGRERGRERVDVKGIRPEH